MAQSSVAQRRFDAENFIGGALCVDFANTDDSWMPDPPAERLADYEAWLAWSRAAGILSEREREAAQRAAQRSPAAARRASREILRVRNALSRVLRSVVHGREPPAAELTLLQSRIGAAHAARRLVWSGGKFRVVWEEPRPGEFDAALRPVLLSAESLLLDPAALARLRECPAERCGWLFLDSSRNRSRRWCSMQTCGNVAKAQRHQARLRRARRLARRGAVA